jgi:hypothetical protein
MLRRSFVRGLAWLGLLAPLLVGASGFGCGSSSSSPGPVGATTTQMFVGTVAGTDALVGLVVTGSKALLFSCGGTNSFSTTTYWFRGTVAPDQAFTLTTSASTATGTGTFTATGANGTISPAGGGAPLTWTAAAPAMGTLTGVYTEDVAGQGNGYLIVEQPSPSAPAVAVGAFKLTSTTEFPLQVTPLSPIAMTAKGIEATVVLPGSNGSPGQTVDLFLLPATATSGE